MHLPPQGLGTHEVQVCLPLPRKQCGRQTPCRGKRSHCKVTVSLLPLTRTQCLLTSTSKSGQIGVSMIMSRMALPISISFAVIRVEEFIRKLLVVVGAALVQEPPVLKRGCAEAVCHRHPNLDDNRKAGPGALGQPMPRAPRQPSHKHSMQHCT